MTSIIEALTKTRTKKTFEKVYPQYKGLCDSEDFKTWKFITIAKLVHGEGTYSYKLTKFKTYKDKVLITCPIHGNFEKIPQSHIGTLKQGCQKCSTGKLVYDTTSFILEANERHENKYSYLKAVYINTSSKLIISCASHGDFSMTPNNHLQKHGCPKCGSNSAKCSLRMDLDTFIFKADKVHNTKYTYPKQEYINNKERIVINCPIHGDFLQRPDDHLSGHGCISCANEDHRLGLEEFIRRSVIIHKNLYKYPPQEYVTSSTKVLIICKEHGEFKQTPNSHLKGHGCPTCASLKKDSKAEREINKFILDLGFHTEKFILKTGTHIDILIPELGIGFEYNGTYWHSTKFRDKNYHIRKTLQAEKEGIELIHIWEHEYNKSKDLILSMIKAKLGKSDRVIYARKCVFKEISTKEARDFCEVNHIQGYTGSSVKLGLFYKKELVMVITLALPRFNLFQGLEIVRLCSLKGSTIVGGASKLLKRVEGPIISYARRDYSAGAVYIKLGFKLARLTEPNYTYHKNKETLSRYQCMKFRLKSLLKDTFDANKTETENMTAAGYIKLYDCGSLVFTLNKEEE